MFNMLGNLTKAAVSVALTPVALAVDVVMIPQSCADLDGPFDRTAALLKNAAECVEEAVKPEK
jgi:uncharacterized protein YgiB involved in biofilm formation